MNTTNPNSQAGEHAGSVNRRDFLRAMAAAGSAALVAGEPKLLSAYQNELTADGIFLGKLATVPRMIESIPQRETLNKRTGAAAVDMETETIAEICQAHDLPMLSIRAISDTSVEPFPAPAHVLFDLAKQETDFVRLGAYLLRHPSALGRLNAFRQRIGVARKVMTEALDKILRADPL